MSTGPFSHPDQWDDAVRTRYQEGRPREQFRDYGTAVDPRVREFYQLNHTHQTRDYVLAQKKKWLALNRTEMGIWEALEFLDTLVDDSDPDTDLSQIEHNLQTAEAIRADGHPRWMQLTGLIHDLGKVLWLWDEPQWAVVGDTFPVGCAFSDRIVFSEFFAANLDAQNPSYSTPLGVYQPGCGLDRVDLSWGHDEYIWAVTRPYLPVEAQWMLRYHSCYPIHREGAYSHLLTEHDHRMLEWVKLFNQYDLYSKGHAKPDRVALRPYYEELIAEYFPSKLRW
ncbi:MAG: inositol oxygenase [Bryobacter sp.]|nr:inositol oxygenase [Bryobacter sp.]